MKNPTPSGPSPQNLDVYGRVLDTEVDGDEMLLVDGLWEVTIAHLWNHSRNYFMACWIHHPDENHGDERCGRRRDC